tara:strand:+ start:1242 stop:2114 length:873 start_codon:yes stop_codon:yes gene_type:complete
MATFEVQVEALTSLDIDGSSAPTQTELSEYLKDGARDVTSKLISTSPSNARFFTRASSEQTSNPCDIGRAQIISVIREAGSDNDWRNCREVPPHLQSRVTDINSLNYASKFNPAYSILDNGKISVFPEPGADPNAFKVYYINNNPVNGSGASLAYNHDDMLYFPQDKVYLVVIYAAIKSLENYLGSLNSAPTVGGVSEELTTTLTATTGDAYGTDAQFLDFSTWFTTVGEFIEDEEDEELAMLQINKINAYVQAYQAQNQANVSSHTHLQLRHSILVRQYESAFGMKPEE